MFSRMRRRYIGNSCAYNILVIYLYYSFNAIIRITNKLTRKLIYKQKQIFTSYLIKVFMAKHFYLYLATVVWI